MRSSAFDPQVNDLLSRMAMPRYARGHVSPVFLYSVTIPMGILCSDMCDHRDSRHSCAANARLIHVLEADLRILVLRGSVMEIMGSGHNNTVLHNRNRLWTRSTLHSDGAPTRGVFSPAGGVRSAAAVMSVAGGTCRAALSSRRGCDSGRRQMRRDRYQLTRPPRDTVRGPPARPFWRYV